MKGYKIFAKSKYADPVAMEILWEIREQFYLQFCFWCWLKKYLWFPRSKPTISVSLNTPLGHFHLHMHSSHELFKTLKQWRTQISNRLFNFTPDRILWPINLQPPSELLYTLPCILIQTAPFPYANNFFFTICENCFSSVYCL